MKDASSDAYKIEKLAQDILWQIRYTRMRQYNLFTQKRGEDFEKMMEKLSATHELSAIQNMIDDEDFWNVTIELASM